MVKKIFKIVAINLLKIAQRLNITYNEINIIVYYLLIPLSWTIMLDCWMGLPITTAMLLLIWVGILIATHGSFREWCDKD